MKKRLLVFLTVFALLVSLAMPVAAATANPNYGGSEDVTLVDEYAAAPADTGSQAGESLASDDVSADKFVYDYANLLTDEEESEFEADLAAILGSYQFGAYVLTVQSLGGVSPMVYADDFYDYNFLGAGDNRDGCILLLAVDSRDWYISTTGYGITALTDAGIDYIGDDMVRYLKDNNWSGGVRQYVTDVDKFVNEAKTNKPYDVGHMPRAQKSLTDTLKGLGIALLISVAIAAIVTAKIKSSYKPVRFNRNASNYLLDGSLRVTGQYDNFITSSVTSRVIESNSGGGSSTHSGSSGTSHGGGGGKF